MTILEQVPVAVFQINRGNSFIFLPIFKHETWVSKIPRVKVLCFDPQNKVRQSLFCEVTPNYYLHMYFYVLTINVILGKCLNSEVYFKIKKRMMNFSQIL